MAEDGAGWEEVQISGFAERLAYYVPWLLPVPRAQAGSGGTPVSENRFEKNLSLYVCNIIEHSQTPSRATDSCWKLLTKTRQWMFCKTT